MLALIPSGSPFLKHHIETSVVFDPTQPAPVSIEPTPEEAIPTESGPKVKQPSKRKASPSKPKAKKKPKVSAPSQQEGTHDIPTDSGRPLTPPAHSSEVPLNVSSSQAHTHGESKHIPPSPSQKGDVGVEQSSLHPPGTHPCVTFDIPIISSTRTHSGTVVPEPNHPEGGAVSPTSDSTTGLIPRRRTGQPSSNDPLWKDYVNRAASRRPDLTRAQVE
ncbi:vegetative cell wall protein gp1-like [Lactuca sativa]|uniref:vegetative cell wall protein gp1-like n=1 Tax=Lactuca sativa TaxID=4236 RepID=UPI000CD91DBD|nr:vegetative cell wall protein gp1-like [Lactuca sativa]